MDAIGEQLSAHCLRPVSWDVRVSKDGRECFGVVEISGDMDPNHSWDDMAPTIGFRNANNRRMSAGVCIGTKVFVCSNKEFSAEHKVLRRHTPNIMRDLQKGLHNFVVGARELWADKWHRVIQMQGTPLSTRDAHHIIVLGMKEGVITAGEVPKVLDEWERPTHAEFSDRNLWSLYNGFTQVLGPKFEKNPVVVADRTTALNGIVSKIIG